MDTKSVGRCVLLLGLLSVASSAVISLSVVANPIGPPPPPEDTTFKLTDASSGLIWLFLMNIPANLFFLTAFLFITGRIFKDRIGNLPGKGWVFLSVVFVLAILVTVVGAFIDYYLVMGIDPDYDEYARVILFDAGNWGLAVALIFLSVLLPAIALLRLTTVAAISFAALITVVNPVWWALAGVFGLDIAFFTIILGLIVLPVIVKLLLHFHNEFVVYRQVHRLDAA